MNVSREACACMCPTNQHISRQPFPCLTVTPSRSDMTRIRTMGPTMANQTHPSSVRPSKMRLKQPTFLKKNKKGSQSLTTIALQPHVVKFSLLFPFSLCIECCLMTAGAPHLPRPCWFLPVVSIKTHRTPKEMILGAECLVLAWHAWNRKIFFFACF